MAYRCEATSLEGFLQQLAANYLPHGYWFYVTGRVPDGKDRRAVDEKLLELYGIDLSRWQRARRKRRGYANMHYLRFGSYFVLLATEGEHDFFRREAKAIRDIREEPLKVAGYSIRVRQGHSHVRIEEGEFQRLKAHLLELALHRTAEKLKQEFWWIPFEPYAGVRLQVFKLLELVNAFRRRAGYEPLPPAVVRRRRKVVKPFEPQRYLPFAPTDVKEAG